MANNSDRLTLANMVEQVHKSGSKAISNGEIVAAVRQSFAKQGDGATFPWNNSLVLKIWKERGHIT
jgi:hypothetical protein